MKIIYKNLVDLITEQPSIQSVSNALFQLGHEHNVIDEVFDIEFTPNRGDCLSVYGLARDLNYFYKTKKPEIYTKNIKNFELKFTNQDKNSCSKISFLKIKIDKPTKKYSKNIENYFNQQQVSKNNFFTDISNYLAYELGQPTHCYDLDKINLEDEIVFKKNDNVIDFKTLLDSTISLDKNTYVFESKGKVLNIAGIMGGKETACSEKTLGCLVECAYFNPESIIGKSLKYNIKSDSSYKFERGVDPNNQEFVLRRFIQLVSEHANIVDIQISQLDYTCNSLQEVENNHERINSILGIDITYEEYSKILTSLGFIIEHKITVPSYRNDISGINDIAEEIARIYGYDNIKSQDFNICTEKQNNKISKTNALRTIFSNNSFNEVINFPFVSEKNPLSIKVDNPLDVNKQNLRLNLKESLLNNLIYNENRQQDSIKIFEISNIYQKNNSDFNIKNMLGIIITGRKGHNYKDFSKQMNPEIVEEIFKSYNIEAPLNFEEIPRNTINSKKKNKIYYAEIDLEMVKFEFNKIPFITKNFNNLQKYKEVSSYPQIIRDLSFLISSEESVLELNSKLGKYSDDILKESFVFDYYKSADKIKVGYRFIFQSNKKTLTEKEVNQAINDIIVLSKSTPGTKIPGL